MAPFAWARKRQKSLLGAPLQLPTSTRLDRRLVLGSLVLLAGTEWPFYLATLCGVLCALGFYGLRRAAVRRQRLDVQVEAG